ncbi:MAG: glycosyltransferase family 4 protein [Pseudonocardiaceae bacterium]
MPQREGVIGGADLHVLDLAAAQLQERDHSPLILTPRAPDDYLKRLYRTDLEVLGPGLFRIDRYIDLPGQRGITLIHAHGYEANYLVAAMRTVSRRWSHLPLVVTAHGWIETTPRLRLQSRLDRCCGKLAEVRIATAARHAPKLRGSRGVVIAVPNGVPDPGRLPVMRHAQAPFRRSLGIPPQATIIGTVGRLSPEKRLDLLLAATQRLIRHGQDIHVLVVGGGDQRTKLESLAERLGLRGKVTFTGLLRDVTPALIAMDVLVQPSDTEGTPRSVLEAMAHQVPVVATDVGDVAELLDHGRCGALVPPDDADLLAQALHRLLADPAHARDLVRCARSRYEAQYTIEVMRCGVENAYQIAYMAHRQGRRP